MGGCLSRAYRLPLYLTTVHGGGRQEPHQALALIVLGVWSTELRSVVDERGPAVALGKHGVLEEANQEPDVGLKTAYPQLAECTRRPGHGGW